METPLSPHRGRNRSTLLTAVMLGLETLPFIQCHHTCGRALGGGALKPSMQTVSG